MPRATVRRVADSFVHDDKIATNYHVVEDMLSGTAKLVKGKKYRLIERILIAGLIKTRSGNSKSHRDKRAGTSPW